jgi:hypothetical protein
MHYHKAKAQKDELNEPHEKSNRPGSAGHYVTLQSVQPDPSSDACGSRRAPEDSVDGCQTTTTPPDLRTDNLDNSYRNNNCRATRGYELLQFVQPNLPYDVCRPTRAPENPDHGYQNTNKNNNYSVPAGGYAVVQPVQRNKSYDVCTSAPRPIHKHQGQSVITQGVRFTEGPKHKAKRKPNQR